jgi:sugar-phosphatase
MKRAVFLVGVFALVLVPSVAADARSFRRGKPDPEPYLRAAQQLDTRPDACVVLEDAPAGVASGHAAGMAVIALLTTHTREELPTASVYIRDLSELSIGLDALGVHLEGWSGNRA